MTSPDHPAPRSPQAFPDEPLDGTSMPALVARRIRLERAANGRVWKAACPFHDDEGASFYVHADGFHCFSCGAHGDAIDFVMRSGSAPSEEAVAILAGKRA